MSHDNDTTVTEMGFTAFGIEACWAEALLVNDYVLRGRGNARKVLSGLRLWPWDTEPRDRIGRPRQGGATSDVARRAPTAKHRVAPETGAS